MKKYMVMGGQPEANEDVEGTMDSIAEEEGDLFSEEDKFEDAKKKLRLVLCRADFQNLPWLLSEIKQRRQRCICICKVNPLQRISEVRFTFRVTPIDIENNELSTAVIYSTDVQE